MGYITKFSLTASPLTVEQFAQVDAALHERNIDYDLEDKEYANQTGFWSSKYDLWDDHEKDVQAISRLFPEVRFELDGEGDDRDDVWCKYFIDGKTCCCGVFTINRPFIESDLRDPEEADDGAGRQGDNLTDVDVMLYRCMQTMVGLSDWDFPWNPNYAADAGRLLAGYLKDNGHSVRWHLPAPPASELPSCEEEPSKVLDYERFRLQWMLDHGYTLTDLIRGLDALREEGVGKESLYDLFSEWERSCGFDSALWPCYREYLAWVGNDPASGKEG